MDRQKNRALVTERHLLGFARSYLSEAFPNPRRNGCPSQDALRALAEEPTRSEGSISSHLSACSPCFNAYLACLERARLRTQRVRRVQRIEITAAIVVSLICFLLITRYRRQVTISRTEERVEQSLSTAQTPGIAPPSSLLIDLGNASPMRGALDVQRSFAPPVIPSSPSVDLILKLPLGSEDRNYSMRLNSHGSAVWSDRAKPHFKHGQMLLHTLVDFSHVTPGRYDLVVVAKDFRVSIPVLVKSVSPANIGKP